MYINRKELEEIKTDIVEGLGGELTDKTDFLIKLMKGDDWSLVIKSHALIESVISELIIAKINQEEIKTIVERLPLHGSEISKIEIVKTYNLIDKEQISFIKSLSELRNKLAHKFEYVEFSYVKYLSTLDKNQRKAWIKSHTWYTSKENENYWNEMVTEKPQLVVFMSVYFFVTKTLFKTKKLQTDTKIEVAKNKTNEHLIKKLV